jgi:hypothetical protein
VVRHPLGSAFTRNLRHHAGTQRLAVGQDPDALLDIGEAVHRVAPGKIERFLRLSLKINQKTLSF